MSQFSAPARGKHAERMHHISMLSRICDMETKSQHASQWRADALNTTWLIAVARLLLTCGCYLVTSATN